MIRWVHKKAKGTDNSKRTMMVRSMSYGYLGALPDHLYVIVQVPAGLFHCHYVDRRGCGYRKRKADGPVFDLKSINDAQNWCESHLQEWIEASEILSMTKEKDDNAL